MLKYEVRPHRQPTSILSIPVLTLEPDAGPAYLRMQRRCAQACGQHKGLLEQRRGIPWSPMLHLASSSALKSVYPKGDDAVMRVRYISKKNKTKGQQTNKNPQVWQVSNRFCPPLPAPPAPGLLRSAQLGEILKSLIMALSNISFYVVKICPMYCFKHIWNSLEYGDKVIQNVSKM